jgi:peptide chain release factor subunit 1
MITAETLQHLTDFDTQGHPLISLYVGMPVRREERPAVRTRVASLLDQIRPITEDEQLSRTARLSIRDDIARIEELLGQQHWKPGAVGLFACSAAGLFEQVHLPRSVRDRILVDTTAWVRPVLAVLEDYHRACVVVLDKKIAHFWELYQDEIQELKQVTDRALRKPDYGGWYGLKEHPVSHKADELEKKHFLRIAQTIDELFRNGRFDVLVVGGHDEETARFGGYLSRERRGDLIGRFSIDPSTATNDEIQREAGELVDRHERNQERERVAEVLDAAAAGKPAAIGLADCLWAGTTAAISELLIHDDVAEPGVVCDNCGWLGLSGSGCPVCGAETRATTDVIDELAERAIDDGSAIEEVRAETPLAGHLVAAFLRFPLPPGPEPRP